MIIFSSIYFQVNKNKITDYWNSIDNKVSSPGTISH